MGLSLIPERMHILAKGLAATGLLWAMSANPNATSVKATASAVVEAASMATTAFGFVSVELSQYPGNITLIVVRNVPPPDQGLPPLTQGAANGNSAAGLTGEVHGDLAVSVETKPPSSSTEAQSPHSFIVQFN